MTTTIREVWNCSDEEIESLLGKIGLSVSKDMKMNRVKLLNVYYHNKQLSSEDMKEFKSSKYFKEILKKIKIYDSLSSSFDELSLINIVNDYSDISNSRIFIAVSKGIEVRDLKTLELKETIKFDNGTIKHLLYSHDKLFIFLSL
jgi:hypothetical protein